MEIWTRTQQTITCDAWPALSPEDKWGEGDKSGDVPADNAVGADAPVVNNNSFVGLWNYKKDICTAEIQNYNNFYYMNGNYYNCSLSNFESGAGNIPHQRIYQQRSGWELHNIDFQNIAVDNLTSHTHFSHRKTRTIERKEQQC